MLVADEQQRKRGRSETSKKSQPRSCSPSRGSTASEPAQNLNSLRKKVSQNTNNNAVNVIIIIIIITTTSPTDIVTNIIIVLLVSPPAA